MTDAAKMSEAEIMNDRIDDLLAQIHDFETRLEAALNREKLDLKAMKEVEGMSWRIRARLAAREDEHIRLESCVRPEDE